MGRIQVLPDRIANKISAGEVVERPAAAVKELLENSLDAGARRIRIEVARGGKSLMRISDDGHGMGYDDALLAFERHATSKLRNVDDLASISTLGFRGEALPSIASVSRLLLETAEPDAETGVRVEIAGGKIFNVEELALGAGTTISVKNLFYNVPARKKFLRTDKTELAHIASLVTHYSLAHLDKSFQLINETGTLLNVTPVETMRDRVYQIFGSETLDELVELETVERELEVAASPYPPESQAKKQTYRLRGFFSKPHIQKLNRNSIFVFVNDRLIRDRVALKAISTAYHNVLPPGSFPFALLFLEMPFEEVDVNVHPSKTEVRFRHSSFVFDFIRDSLRDRLIRSKPVSQLPLPKSPQQPGVDLPFSENTLRTEQDGPPPEDKPRPVEVGGFTLRTQPPPTARIDFEPGETFAPAVQPSSQQPRSDFTPAPLPDTPEPSRPHSRERLVEPPSETLGDLSRLHPLGQLHDSFIVAAGSDGLWLIDQHVAHERILFEQVLAGRMQGKPEVQRLLMPLIVNLRPEQHIAFDATADELRANGFEIEPFGHGTLAVKAAPAALGPAEVESLLHEILDTPEKELRELSLDYLRSQTAATIACHAAIKINMPLDMQKMHWLLDELAKTDVPMACPHGRPIALKYPTREILKAFHRV